MTTIAPRRRGRRGQHVPFVAAVLALVIVALPAPALPAAADTITWGIAPASAEGADGRVSVRATLDPGQQYTDFVELSNLSAHDLTFALAAADGTVTDAGDFDVLADSAASTRAGRWVQIAETVEIEARSSVIVPFTVTVPADATPGDHPAGIVASLATEGPAAGGVDVVARTGVRLHLRVPGEIEAALTPQITSLRFIPNLNPFAPGELTLDWEIENAGNVRLGGVAVLSVAGLGGSLPQGEEIVLGDFRELLPEGRRAGTITVQTWPLFLVDAQVGVEPRIVGDDDLNRQPDTATTVASAVAIPWTQLAMATVLILFIVLVAVRVRARGARAKALASVGGAAG